ncbi:MAG: peptide-methionine (S)-S-oxide reductase MsrA [Candidatus Omnitrophica bacterium]|nr:peptide-methionine (S)-S-oxide reductase MsrA [Candidatus Omnitrophota bacterium]
MGGARMAAAEQGTARTETATFAGGCFWCLQQPFDETPGVISTSVGYTGGTTADPTYEQVSTGATGHAEALQAIYDPSKATYEQLLDVFWSNINPTTVNGQFADKGTQYRTAIFYHNDEQQRLAEASKERLARSGKFDEPIATEIVLASVFYRAEEYHQHYYKKQAAHYNAYKVGSGRAGYLKKVWGGR